jgi:hypothetical protein
MQKMAVYKAEHLYRLLECLRMPHALPHLHDSVVVGHYPRLQTEPIPPFCLRGMNGLDRKLTFWVLPKAGFLALKFNRSTNVEPCTNAQSKPFSPAFGNTLLCAGIVSVLLILKKSSSL